MHDGSPGGAAASTLAEQIVAVSTQPPGPGRARPATSTLEPTISTMLSADELLLVENAGYHPCGVVVGAAVFHVGLVGARMANVELVPLSQALLAAREQAVARLREQASQLGATGVLGVQLEIKAFEDKRHLARVVAIGTAVARSVPAAGATVATEPFVAGMSGQELSVLVSGGYEPVDVVMGVCVYHIARQRPRRTAQSGDHRRARPDHGGPVRGSGAGHAAAPGRSLGLRGRGGRGRDHLRELPCLGA